MASFAKGGRLLLPPPKGSGFLQPIDFMKFVVAAIGPASQYTYDSFMEAFGRIVNVFSPKMVATDYIGGDQSIVIELMSLTDLIWLQKQMGRRISIEEYATLESGEKIPVLTIDNLPNWE